MSTERETIANLCWTAGWCCAPSTQLRQSLAFSVQHQEWENLQQPEHLAWEWKSHYQRCWAERTELKWLPLRKVSSALHPIIQIWHMLADAGDGYTGLCRAVDCKCSLCPGLLCSYAVSSGKSFSWLLVLHRHSDKNFLFFLQNHNSSCFYFPFSFPRQKTCVRLT